jgi:hypothetical protein
MYIQALFHGPLFWGILLLVILVVWFVFRAREPFTVEDLNIQISPDNRTLTIPNTIQVKDNQPLNLLGDMTAKSVTASSLTSGTSSLGTATATTVQIGNATLSNKNGLSVNTNIECPQATITGNLNVSGDICIERDGHRWYLIAKGENLHIVKNDPNYANYTEHRNNEPHVIIASNGNIWTSRQNYSGWVGDNLSWIRSLGV